MRVGATVQVIGNLLSPSAASILMKQLIPALALVSLSLGEAETGPDKEDKSARVELARVTEKDSESHGAHYHTANDTIGLVSFPYAAKVSQLGLSIIATLAGTTAAAP